MNSSFSFLINWKMSDDSWSLSNDLVDGLKDKPSSSTDCSAVESVRFDRLYTIEFGRRSLLKRSAAVEC